MGHLQCEGQCKQTASSLPYGRTLDSRVSHFHTTMHSCFLTTERFRCYIKNALFPLKTNVGITFALVLITFLKNIQTFFVLPTFVYFCKNFKTCDNSVGQL